MATIATKEANVFAAIQWSWVREMNFLGRPINARHDAPGAKPRRQQEFRCLARGSPTASQLVAKNHRVLSEFQIDPVCLVDQALIAAETFVRGAERQA
jgi:hypothetical protein